jgi:HK97 family phage prohead protease
MTRAHSSGWGPFTTTSIRNDLIEPGAFTRTLTAGKKWPVLWQHKIDEPIGFCQITDAGEGLQVNGTLELSDPTARKAFTFMKAGVIRDSRLAMTPFRRPTTATCAT